MPSNLIPFNEGLWNCFSGAARFHDGSEPMASEIKYQPRQEGYPEAEALLIVDAGGIEIHFIYDNGEEEGFSWTPNEPPHPKNERKARDLAKAVTDYGQVVAVSEPFLRALGFELLY